VRGSRGGGLNEALWAKAAGQKLLRTARVRAHTTVIPANVVYPTGSGLLARAVGRLVRAARRVQAAGGATGTVMTDRRRAAARRVREIAARLRSRAKVAREENSTAIARVTGELADLAQKAAAQAAAVLRNGRLAVPKAIGGRVRGRLRRALDELAVTIQRTATIMAQARSRLAGQMPGSAVRLVSPHDPDARPIRKGRVDRPVELGYKGPGHRQRRRNHPAGTPNMPAGSVGSSSGEPAVKAGSATSSADTAGIAPGSMAVTEPRSGAGTASSPQPGQDQRPGQLTPARHPGHAPAATPVELSPPTFSGRSS
jgi:hypothetical protein